MTFVRDLEGEGDGLVRLGHREREEEPKNGKNGIKL